MKKENINKFNEQELFDAKELRTAKIGYSDAGCYKWWASEKDLKKLLKKLDPNIKFNDIVPDGSEKNKNKIEKNLSSNFYCIYVGKSTNLKKRLNTHVNGKIRSSTLRKTIASLMEYYEDPQTNVNKFIDNLKVEYIPTSIDDVGIQEKKLINEYFHILNNEENEHKLAIKYNISEKLTKARKTAEEKNPAIFKRIKNK